MCHLLKDISATAPIPGSRVLSYREQGSVLEKVVVDDFSFSPFPHACSAQVFCDKLFNEAKQRRASSRLCSMCVPVDISQSQHFFLVRYAYMHDKQHN